VPRALPPDPIHSLKYIMKIFTMKLFITPGSYTHPRVSCAGGAGIVGEINNAEQSI